MDKDTTSIILEIKEATNKNKVVGLSINFLKKKKSLVVLEYIQCPAIALLGVTLKHVKWFASDRRFYVILAPLAASHTSAHLLWLVLFFSHFFLILVQVLALASYTVPHLPAFHSLCLPLHAHLSVRVMQKWKLTPSRAHLPKMPTQVGRLANTRDSRVHLCCTIEENHLFYGDVHNLNREKKC